MLQAIHDLGGEGQRREIVARAERIASFSPAELALPAPVKARGNYQRLVDHQLSWALTALKRRGQLENPRWSHWQLPKALAPAAADDAMAAPVSPERLGQLQGMPYADYLRTLEWQRTRVAALRLADHRCQLDATHAGRRLDVHHSTYERRGAELSSDLVVLCADCHARHHELQALTAVRREAVAASSSKSRALLTRALKRLR